MRTLYTFAFIVLLAFASVAEDDHDHAPRFGGVVVESGHHHLEVVARDGAIELHVGGVHGTPEMVAGATATAAVLSEGNKIEVELKPHGNTGTVLTGTGPFKAAKGTIIVITLKMPEHDPEQTRIKLD
jgi:hypothetical protein